MNSPSDPEQKALDFIRTELTATNSSKRKRIFQKFALAALGSIPWVGGFLSAAASIKPDEESVRADNLQTQWLEEHARKIDHLARTLTDIAARFESLGEQIDDRLQSEEYLDLVRQAFRTWDQANTDEKRQYVANLISNASGTSLCSDDVVRLFIDWLDLYHEMHFAVIREVHRNPGCTRYEIWQALRGEFPREDSAEADLFRLLVRELNIGGVIRQARDTNEEGEFLRRRRAPRSRNPSPTMESAFEDSKPYVLTELGRQFVHYTMNEVVPRVGQEASNG